MTNSVEYNQKAYSEVLGVLFALGNNYVEKIPKNVMEFIIERSDRANIPDIDKMKRIEELGISDEARSVLTMLKLKYWCKNENEKLKLIELLKENDKKNELEIRNKIFNSSKITSSDNDKNQAINNSIVNVEKNGFFYNIFRKIKEFLFKNRK